MTLTKLAALFKKVIRILAIFVVAYYTWVFIIFPFGRGVVKMLFPPRNPPKPLYGKLEPLEFVEKPVEGTPKYILNTKDGKLPRGLPNKMTVYKFKPPQFSYEAGKTARKDAAFLGFSDSDLITDLKGTSYKWRSLKTAGILEIYRDTKEILLITNLVSNNLYLPKGYITKADAIEDAKNLFRALGRFDDSLYPAGYSVAYLGRIQGNKILETQNPSEAQFAQVHLFRNIENYKILGPDPRKGLLSATVGYLQKEASPLNYPTIEAYYWEIDATPEASYPIISVEQAWNAVAQGKGVISNVTPKEFNPYEGYGSTRIDEILINNIYLAYYETPKQQTYMQPIYVFDGNFRSSGTQGGATTVYFPAVTGEWVNAVAIEAQSQE